MYWSVTYSPRLIWDYALLYVRLQQQGIYIGHCSKPCHMDTQLNCFNFTTNLRNCTIVFDSSIIYTEFFMKNEHDI